MTKEILKKIQIILILFAILVTGLGIKSLAADYTCDLTVEADKTQIKAGESVTLTVKVSNIQAGEGIAIYNTVLEYPTEIFDMKLQADSAGKWSNMAIENSISFIRENYENSSENQEIAKIVLTAKEDATLGKQTITLKNNEFSGTEGFTVADISKQVEIVKASTPGGDDGNNTNQDGNNTNGGNNANQAGNGNNSGNTNKGNTNGGSSNGVGNSGIQQNAGKNNSGTSATPLPKTGIVQDCLIGAIVIAVVVAIGFYVKYRRAY